MKKKLIIKDFNNKETIIEFIVRSPEHHEATLKYKASVYIPKKGKGSYKRSEKHKNKNIDY